MPPIVNLMGKKFGKLEVIRYAGQSKWKTALWECRCECGNSGTYRSFSLQSGHTKSCGCLKDVSRKEFGESAFGYLYRAYKKGAERRKHIFSICQEVFRVLTSSPCFYCGSYPSAKMKKYGGYGEYIYNGIDRIDNSLGYTEDNCVPCCWKCNKLKGTFSYKEFIEQVNQIHKYQARIAKINIRTS